MERPTAYLEAIIDLETRHDDLLQQLDDLDKRVERVLAEWIKHEPAAAAQAASSSACPATC